MNISRVNIKKTEEELKSAILVLLESNAIEDIMVSDICEKAQINRAVFYAYFSDKYALINSKTE